MRGTDSRDLLIGQLRAELAQRDATIAQRDADIAQRDAVIAQRDAIITLLHATLAQREETLEQAQGQLAQAQGRIAQLEATLHRHFKQPPPSGSDAAKPPSKGPRRSAKKRGAQLGHPGRARPLLPAQQVSEIVTLVPPSCSHCGKALRGLDPEPSRHQVVEVPPLTPQVTEYRCHRLRCDHCGARTRASLPPDVPHSCFGPRLGSLVAICTGKYHLSKRMVEELLADFLGVELSLGSVCRLEKTVSSAVQQPVALALKSVPMAPVVHQDETSWWQQNGKAWLWVAVTTLVTVFRIALSRGNKVCKQMLGESFSGTLVSDRFSSYRWIPDGQRQMCWAHLKRDFAELEQIGGPGARLGKDLGTQTRRLFRYWHRVRDGTLPWSELKSKLKPIRREIQNLLRDGALWHTGKARSLSRELLRHEPAMWRFAEVPGVEPTNNAAERALRQAVLWRRGSFGTQSAGGSEFVERILTVVATLRQQGRNVLEYLTAACQAQLNHQPAPSLLLSPAYPAACPTP